MTEIGAHGKRGTCARCRVVLELGVEGGAVRILRHNMADGFAPDQMNKLKAATPSRALVGKTVAVGLYTNETVHAGFTIISIADRMYFYHKYSCLAEEITVKYLFAVSNNEEAALQLECVFRKKSDYCLLVIITV